MKILHITPSFAPAVGGIETVVRDLTLHLRRNGIAADVLHISPGNKQGWQEQVDGASVWRVPLIPNRLLGVTPPIRSLLMKYDLLHVHDPQGMALSGNVLLQGRGKKKVLSTHGGYFHTANHSWAKQLHWKWFAAKILRAYDAVLASSTADRDRFQSKATGVRPVPNGVNVARFIAVRRSAIVPATRWIYWGRLSRNKRIDLLVDTVRQARAAGLDIDLTIAGADFDGLSHSIQARIAGFGLNQHVRVAGPLSDGDLLSEFTTRAVFITASEYEGFGLSVIEAMAAGLVVICRNMAPLNGFVVPEKTGAFLAFDGSAADLNVIKALSTTSMTKLSTIQNCARAAALPHGWDSVVRRYIDVYDELMRANAAAA